MGILDNMLKIGVISGLCILSLLIMWVSASYILGRRRSKEENVEPIKLKNTRFEERRQHPRAKIKWPVKIETPAGPVQGETANISLGGAFICCASPLALGDVFPLSMEIPDHGPLNVTGEVVWSNRNVPDDQVVTRGMGIRFIQISVEDRHIVNSLVQGQVEKDKEDA